jgi:ParB-like chromosome segregation protein Spo0J
MKLGKKPKPVEDDEANKIVWYTLPYTTEFERHPLSGNYRDMTADEFENLVASIKANGQREPIVCAQHEDKPYILDGWHRRQACVKAGVNLKVRDYDPAIDGPLEVYAESLNEHRRHLTREELRQRLEARIKANPEISDRQHAAAVGVDNKTASSVRRDLEERKEIPHVQTTTDTTGRQQQTTKAKSKKLPKVKALKTIKENWPRVTDEASQMEIFSLILDNVGIDKLEKWLGMKGYTLTITKAEAAE